MLAAFTMAACQKGEDGSSQSQQRPVETPYAQDIARICDAEKLSGALEQEEGARVLTVAQYLGSAIETEEARNFLAELTGFVGADKGKRLRDEAKRAGLAGCPLADTWK
jgi:hypothetical protein